MTPTEVPTTTPKKLMTVDEYWDFVNRPENDNRFLELRKGEVIELSRPTRRHGAVTGNISRIVGNYAFHVRRGYVVSNDSGVILADEPGTVVGPDVGYFTDAKSFAEIHPKWGEEVPVLAVEVLSPNDKMSEVNEKIEDYLRNGVRLVWLVDYERRKATVYRPDRTLTVLQESDVISGGDELPGFACRVSDLFGHAEDESQPHPPVA